MINYYIDDAGTLYIYIDNSIICTVSECGEMTKKEIEILINEILEEKRK